MDFPVCRLLLNVYVYGSGCIDLAKPNAEFKGKIFNRKIG
ncbi:hypothetical protein HMPREF9098_0236 [Kingella denitrificans ATCC 33394]|uniref:Uncharacterized protein n=1 Tax=Kingella denitrificans ATCC 33394 TaxID=888741 RepID=F0EWK0_9NEIS|nr:hypothetical protein HMPREF9098_0236 [Kingella denitrificans ATCC 33394]